MNRAKQETPVLTGMEVAVIGMAARFPGAGTIEGFWDNVARGVESVSHFTAEELEEAGNDPALIRLPNYIKARAMLGDCDYFDGAFFGYTDAESLAMDPQIRLFHQCVWAALEDAALDPRTFKGRIGLYAGAASNLTWEVAGQLDAANPGEQFSNITLGSRDSLCTQVSYNLDLKGPAVLVQTACSTSLVAIHMACQALLAGECAVALAGGVSLRFPQKRGYLFQEGMILSSDGRCKPFADDADGTIDGDGVGVVVLTLLERVLDGPEHIYAVVKGSAVNNDGRRKVGYTAPSVKGQAIAVKSALRAADVAPASIGYIEAHGTGTSLGDPIEIEALAQALGRRNSGSCPIGSVKGNIGHLDTAAGVAGFIKAVLSLYHKQIPPTINCSVPNRAISFADAGLHVNTRLMDWAAGHTPRRAGVSSFGIGGTNAHVVLEEWITPAREDDGEADHQHHLLVVSAPDRAGLDRATANLGDFFRGRKNVSLQDAAYTLQKGRRPFPFRRSFVCRDVGEAAGWMSAEMEGDVAPALDIPVGEGTVFLFPGQGSQYVGMGADLYREEPLFRRYLDQCFEMMNGITCFDPAIEIDRTDMAQPLLFAVEYALARVLMDWGIQPSVMLGHSIGQYVAATVAGVFALEDGLRVVMERGRLMRALPGGIMTAVSAPAEDVRPLLPPELSVAAINSPASCVASGPETAMERFETELTERGIENRRLHTSHAFHSPMMEPALEPLLKCFDGIRLQEPSIPIICNVTGLQLSPQQAADPNYWVQHTRQSVHFSDGLRTAFHQGGRLFLEVGPGRVLSTFLRQHDEVAADSVSVNLMRHPRQQLDDGRVLLQGLGRFWQAGGVIDWGRFHGERQPGYIPLPSYPFEKKRHWPSLDPVKKISGLLKGNSAGGIKRRSPAQWLYEPLWRRGSRLRNPDPEVVVSSDWLLVGDDDRQKKVLEERLRRDSADVCHSPEDRDFRRLLSSLPFERKKPLIIVYLWSMNHRERFLSLLRLAEAIGSGGYAGDVFVRVFAGATADVLGGERVCPDSALLMGAVRTIPLEFNNLACQLLDVEMLEETFQNTEEFIEMMLSACVHPVTGSVAAIRRSHFWELDVQQASSESVGTAIPLRQRGVYVITGGLGGIGLTIADYLARRVNARLVLIDPAPSPVEAQSRLESAGAEVLVSGADIADSEAMAMLLEQVNQRFGPVNGLIHCAGIAEGTLIHQLDFDAIERMLKPKRDGLLVLDRFLAPQSPDFLFLCSSLNAVSPVVGQVGYCAANAFLDAFAEGRDNPAGARVMAVAWDTWKGVGMAVKHSAGQPAGSEGISPAEGVEIFRRALEHPRPRLLVSIRDPKGETLATSHLSPEPDCSPALELPARSLPQRLRELFAAVLGDTAFGMNDDFFEKGGDSLKASVLTAKINRAMGLALPLAELFNYPTPTQLADRVLPASQPEDGGIGPLEKMDYYPVSSQQRRLFVLQQIDPESTAFHIFTCLRLKGSLDIPRFRLAFEDLAERHESLRTSFDVVEGEPVQRLHAHGAVDIRQSSGETALPFDLTVPPLWRVSLTAGGDDCWDLKVEMHHIIADGLSVDILMDEFTALYRGRTLEPLAVHYKEYCRWQQSPERQAGRREQETFWLEALAGQVPVLNLPLDAPRPPVQDSSGMAVTRTVGQPLAAAIKELAKQEHVTLFTLLLAVYYVFLNKVCRQEDLVVGTPVAGRLHGDFLPVVGMFVNMLALRIQIDGRQPFREFLQQVKTFVLEAFDLQDYPFEQLVEKVEVVREPSRHPLFDTALVFQDRQPVDPAKGSLGEIVVEPLELRRRASLYDLTLEVTPLQSDLELTFVFAAGILNEDSVARFLTYFETAATEVAASPNGLIKDIAIVPPEEKTAILERMNGPLAAYPDDLTLQELFSRRAAQTPGAVALTGPSLWDPGQRFGQLTYGFLDEYSDLLGQTLEQLGARPGFPIPLLFHRGVEMVAAILAVLKAGGAYLPIDPDYPQERIRYMVEDSGASLCLVSEGMDIPTGLTARRLAMGGVEELRREIKPPEEGSLNRGNVNDSANPAYIIYTSGTTGRPKGVVILQRNIVSLMCHRGCLFDFSPADVWTLFHSYCFDFSVWEMYGPLLSGGMLVTVPLDAARDTLEFLTLLRRHGVTVLNQTPLAFYRLSDTQAGRPEIRLNLRYIIFGGEALKPSKLKDWRELYPAVRFINMFGITETTVHVTFKEIRDRDIQSGLSNIGIPLPTLRTLVVDQDDNPLPAGISGEMLVAGAGVGAGYLNRPELTHEKFVLHPQCPGLRMYRSGDLARALPGGDMEYLGRCDFQVKIRGHRIELGEIQAKLLAMERVNDALVVPRSDSGGEPSLCAYIVPETGDGPPLEGKDFRGELSATLPSYMIPSWFVLVNAFPLTSTGKVNRRALPEPNLSGRTSALRLPETSVEQRLAQLWADVLEVEPENIGLDSSFFELGGHSLKATTLSLKIQQEFRVTIPLLEMFRSPTLGEQAALLADKGENHRDVTVPAAEKREFYPLSPAQQRLFLLQQMEGQGTTYHITLPLIFDRRIETAELAAVFNQLVERHEAFRTAFVMLGRQPVQRILPALDVELEILDPIEEAGAIDESLRRFIRPFDLSEPPLARVGLAEMERRWLVCVDMHHIIGDAVSLHILAGEFVRLLEGVPLPPLSLQYRDFACWSRGDAHRRLIEEQEDFWLRQLEGPLPVLDLPLDLRRPSVQSFDGGNRRFLIPEAEARELAALAQSRGATMFVLGLSVFFVFLSKLSGQEDMIVGTPVAGRRLPGLESIVGMFVNTLALRGKPAANATFLEFLEGVNTLVPESLEHQDMPLERLLKRLDIPRDTGRNPLFDVMFTWQHHEASSMNLHPMETDTAKFDLSLDMAEVDGGIHCHIEYCSRLFKEETIDRFAGYFQHLVSALVKGPHRPLKEFQLMSMRERQRMLETFSQTAPPREMDTTLPDLWRQSVSRSGDRVAVVAGRHCLTYRELDRRAAGMARDFVRLGAGPDRLVGVLLERSPETMAAIIGVLTCGAAYLPMDPTAPAARIGYMASDSNAVLMVASKAQQETWDSHPFDCPLLYIEDMMDRAAGEFRDVECLPQQWAYCIYTSGTTGKPKGVAVPHRALANRLLVIHHRYQLGADDVILQKTPLFFDVSVCELFRWIPGGGRLCLLEPGGEREPAAMAKAAGDYRVTTMDFVPAMLALFLDYLRSAHVPHYAASLRWVFVGVETLDPQLAALFNRTLNVPFSARLINAYGPSEATVDVTAVDCSGLNGGEPVSIGKPIQNARVYILDRFLNPQPIGVIGEIYIAGTSIALGYLNRQELTTEAFIDDPFQPGEIMYRTGDFGRFQVDGNIQFCGRRDHQVKIRGHRVETAGVESEILDFPGIKGAVVIARKDQGNQNYLYAYVVPEEEGTTVNGEELRRFLGDRLPAYMIPSFFSTIPRIPLTANEKVDVSALPEPELSHHSIVPPTDPLEKKLAAIWTEVLGVEESKIGVTSDFFALGGHSLSAALVSAQMREVFGIEVSIMDMFRFPTIQQLRSKLTGLRVHGGPPVAAVEKRDVYPLTPSQQRLFVLQQMMPQSVGYNMPVVFGLQDAAVDEERIESVFHRLAARHQSFRTAFVLMGAQPVQRILPDVSFRLEAVPDDLESFVRPFDLSEAPLMRAGVIRRGNVLTVVLDMHHIISDGFSMELLKRECLSLLKGDELQPLDIAYVDFAVWWHEQDHQEYLARQEAFWLDVFAAAPPPLALPLDFPRPASQSFAGGTVPFFLESEWRRRLEALASQEGATLYMALLALFNVFLAKISGQEDIVVGSPVAGRNRFEVRRVIGNFINTLPLRCPIDMAVDFRHYLGSVRDFMLPALENQSYPFEQLVERLEVARDAGRNPLFDVMLVFQSSGADADDRIAASAGEADAKLFKVAKFDLTLHAEPLDGVLDLCFEYCADLFAPQSVERLAAYFLQVAGTVVDDADVCLGDIHLISQEQREEILNVFNNTDQTFVAAPSIIHLFRQRVEENPNAIAIMDGNLQVDYRFFHRLGQAVATGLTHRGAGNGEIVMVKMERSLRMTAALFGILSAGAVYMPVDPSLPDGRVEYMRQDSGASITITDRDPLSTVPPASPGGEMAEGSPGPLDPAYVIYTSGSTGKPKGVLVGHDALLNLCLTLDNLYPVLASDTYLLKTSIVFDVSITELLGWFFHGGRMAVLPAGAQKDPLAMLGFIARHRITHLNFVPSMFNVWTGALATTGAAQLRSVRYIFLAGEALNPEPIETMRRLAPHVAMANLYGPTEATVYSSGYDLQRRQPGEPVPIGKPLANMWLYILDRQAALQPIGIPGELCIGGAGLAEGYLNRPDLTAQAFVEVNLDSGESTRLYKSGDLARWRPDGDIEYLGRIDQQVKIRGYRVETGEIEAHLLRLPGIRQALVIPRRRGDRDANQGGGDYLCAYLVASEAPDVQEIKSYLARFLPHYMIPSYFVPLAELPLTPGGKLDRAALPEPRVKVDVEVPVEGALDELVASVWQEVLGSDGIGAHHNFFEAGGNSLDLIRVGNRLSELLGRPVDAVKMFQFPTIHTFSRFLEGAEPRTRPAAGPSAPSAGDVDVAVIGMAGRFPGADNVRDFWRNIRDGVESVTFYSMEELAAAGVSRRLLEDPAYVRCGGGVLEGKEWFDAAFFNYTPAEAELMDPQMRIFHETVWEALESAGYIPDDCGVAVGLYAGSSSSFNWEAMALLSGKQEMVGQFAASHLTNRDVLATRISYKLNLNGPACLVQTACSTSLVAVDLARRGLLDRQCRMAVAGGVSVFASAASGYLYEQDMIYSPDGHCRAFDAGAKGTVPGEGSAAVVLKLLPEAVADGDSIHAVIKGSTVNNDGNRKVGFTAPSIEGQVEAIAGALAEAGVNADTIGLVEGHGTGTILGDPIELQALTQAFDTSRRGYCALGSVKTNVGHLDAAAGVAGLIKAVQSLKHRVIPPSLHFRTPNPNFSLDDSPFYVSRESTPWPTAEHPRRAGVSSFGIGGTNAHVVLEEWRPQEEPDKKAVAPDWLLLPLSTRRPNALTDAALRMEGFLRENNGVDLQDVAYTLAAGRKHFPYRHVVLGTNRQELIEALAGEAGGQPAAEPDIVFAFSGQGSQYIDMGRHLYDRLSLFRTYMDHCFETIESITGVDARSILYPGPGEGTDPGVLESFAVTSPAKLAFEYALALLLMDWGVKPSAMIGHSFGEYVAACVSGVLSLEDVLRMAWIRGRLMDSLPDGAMLSVPLGEEELQPYLTPRISLAAVNGPGSCAVSGTEEDIETLRQALEQLEVECARLRVPKAGHSYMMDPILGEFASQISGISFRSPEIPYISTLAGDWIDKDLVVTPGYWADHLRRTVRFADGLSVLLERDSAVFVQVGSDRSLLTCIRQHPGYKEGHTALNLIRHPKDEVDDLFFLYHKVGVLWMSGVSIDWGAFYRHRECRRIPLPTYPFQRTRYWLDGDLIQKAGSWLSGRAALKEATDIGDLFYIPSWKRTLIPRSTTVGNENSSLEVMIFEDTDGLSARLSKRLLAAGSRVAIVRAAEDFAKTGDGVYTIDPMEKEHYRLLLENLRQDGRLPHAVIHLWGVGAPCAEPHAGFFSLVFLAAAFGRLGVREPVQFKVVCGDMLDVGGEGGLDPVKASVMGPVRVIPMEYPNIGCSLLDIRRPAEGEEDWDLVADAVIGVPTPEPGCSVAALRGQYLWRQVFEPYPLPAPEQPAVLPSPGAVVLVTGGLGGVGLELAACLAEMAPLRLVLLGRSSFPAREDWRQWLRDHDEDYRVSLTIKRLLDLEDSGSKIWALDGDVTDVEGMRQVKRKVETVFGPVNGIIHAAGVMSGGVIQLQDADSLREAVAAKIDGTLVLDEVFGRDLDFWILCSSVNALLPNYGQVGYCAANAFLDAFANSRQSVGGPVVMSINWTRWRHTGMSVAIENKHHAATGEELHGGIDAAEAKEAFRRLLHYPLPQAIVAECDVAGLQQDWYRSAAAEPEDEGASDTVAVSRLRPELTTPYQPPQTELEETCVEIWRQFFGFQEIGILDRFFELGGDSLKAIQLVSLSKKSGIQCTVQQLLLEQTIRDLCRLVESVEEPLPASGAEAKIGAIDDWTAENQDALVRAIDRNSLIEAAVKQRDIQLTYPLSPIQTVSTTGSLEPIAGSVVYFEHQFHCPEGVEGVAGLLESLIEAHSLLRSVMVKNGEDYAIRQFAPAPLSRDQLPLFDLSPFAAEIQTRIQNEAWEVLSRPFDVIDRLLYRLLVFELSSGTFSLVISFNHLIFDGEGVAVLKRSIDLALRGEFEAPAIEYSDYVEFWRRDFSGKGLVDPVDMVDIVDVLEFVDSVREIKKDVAVGELLVDGFELDIGDVADFVRDHYHDWLLLAYGGGVCQLFRRPSVPVLFVSHGRRYKEVDFSGIVGDFHDYIPLMVTESHLQRPLEFIEAVQRCRRLVRERTVNFSCLLSRGFFPGIEVGDMASPFDYNSIIGSFDHFRGQDTDARNRVLLRGVTSSLLFRLGVFEDVASGRLWISYLQNSTLDAADVRNTLKRIIKKTTGIG
jgi:amino acid adenylation domain-containing protein